MFVQCTWHKSASYAPLDTEFLESRSSFKIFVQRPCILHLNNNTLRCDKSRLNYRVVTNDTGSTGNVTRATSTRTMLEHVAMHFNEVSHFADCVVRETLTITTVTTKIRFPRKARTVRLALLLRLPS